MSKIVVSRQKLKEYIKRKFSGLIKKDLEEIVDSKSSHDIKLKIVEFVNKKIDELKIPKNVEALVLLFSLISFYFRKDNSKNVTNVKFGEKDSRLLDKTNNWIDENMKGDVDKSKENMSQLFNKAKNITEEQWKKMANLITAISAGENGSNQTSASKEEEERLKKEKEAEKSHPSDQAPQFPQQQGQGGYGQQQQGQPSSSSLSPEEQNKINEIQALTKALNDEYNTIYTKYRGKSKGSANFIEICRSVSEDVKRFQDPELRRILVNGRVDAGMDVKTAILQPFVKVIEQLYAYYENIDTSVAKAEKFIQELESLKFDSESYKSAKANLTAAVDKHKKLKEELVEFQTKQMPKVNTGTFDFVPPRL